MGTKIFLTGTTARKGGLQCSDNGVVKSGFSSSRRVKSGLRVLKEVRATNLVRFIIQECSEAIIAAYLYKGLDTQTSGERERTLNLASSAAALVTTP